MQKKCAFKVLHIFAVHGVDLPSKIWRVLVVSVCQYRYYKYLQFD